MKKGFVYVLVNKYNSVFYLGVTSSLSKRVWEHKAGIVKGFTWKYNVHKLVYYEAFEDINEAIKREKYLKGKRREYKKKLIEKMNPEYGDLYESIM